MIKETTTPKTLLADEATIQERQLSVRVLTIGTKQVTQTLFRQLVEEDVIEDETGCLKGEVWGWVNLHIDCAKRKHLHAIWEDHGQLKRSCTRPFISLQGNSVSYTYDSLQDELKAIATIYVCLVALTGKGFYHWKEDATSLPLTIKGIAVSVPVSYDVRRFFDAPYDIKKWEKNLEEQPDNLKKEWYQQQIDSIKQHSSDFLSGELKNCFREKEWDALKYINPEQYTSHDDARKAMENVADEMNTLAQNWRQSYKAVEDAGQLFVAVSGVWK